MSHYYLFRTKNSPFYQIAYWKNGKQTSKSTKTRIKSDALLFLTQFKEKIIQKKVIPKTFIEFENEYLEWVSQTHSRSYLERAVKLSFKMFKKFIQADLLLTDISVNLVDKFFSTTFSRAEYAASLYLRTLKAAFNTAVRWGLIESNVFAKIHPPKAFKTIPTYINEDELNKILEVTREEYLKNLFEFAFYTGARLNEILTLKWDNINFAERVITIRNTDQFTTKNKRDRIIPINNRLMQVLESLYSRNITPIDFIFSRVNGVKLNTNYVSKKFKSYVRKAGLSEQIHFHTLRHSFASLLHQKGASLTVVKDLLGHSDLKTTLIYSHLSKENLIDAVQLIGINRMDQTQKKINTKGLQYDINLN